jgi:hypothetical protein
MSDDDAKRFKSHLEWSRKEVATWPEWKRNLLGLRFSDKKRLDIKSEEDNYDFRSKGW